MSGSRSKWLRKVVFSRNPLVLQMLKERLGEERANKLTYKAVIKECKKMWHEKVPGVEKWSIYKEPVKES